MDLVLVLIAVAVLGAAIICGGSWQDFPPNVLATLLGVFIAIRAEQFYASRREKKEARQTLDMLRSELSDNLRVAKRVGQQRLDLSAVVTALLSLSDEFWQAVSRGGRVGLIRDLKLLERIAHAYASVRNLRTIADLYFKGGELVRGRNNVGFMPKFDALRKTEAKKAADRINEAMAAIDKSLKT